MRQAYELSSGRSNRGDWEFHDTKDALVRYLRDRRIRTARDLTLFAGLGNMTLTVIVKPDCTTTVPDAR